LGGSAFCSPPLSVLLVLFLRNVVDFLKVLLGLILQGYWPAVGFLECFLFQDLAKKREKMNPQTQGLVPQSHLCLAALGL